MANKSDLPETVGFLDLVRSTPVPADARHFAVSPTSKKLLVATPNRLILHNLDTFRQENSFRLDEGEIDAVTFGPDDLVVLSQRVGNRSQVRTLNLKTEEFGPPFAIPARGMPQVTRLVAVPKSRFVIGTTTSVGDVLFDTTTAKVAEGWPAAQLADAVVAAPSRDGEKIAVGAANRPIRLWDAETATLGQPFEASSGFNRVAFNSDGTELIGLGTWGRIRVWDVETPQSGERR